MRLRGLMLVHTLTNQNSEVMPQRQAVMTFSDQPDFLQSMIDVASLLSR